MNEEEINKSSREYVIMRQKQYLEQISETDPEVSSCIDYYENEGSRRSIEVTMPNKEKYPGKRPGVLLFFGGGFHIGSPKIFRETAVMLARQGYVAMCADYRINVYHGTTAEDSMKDGAAAWKYVKENSGKWDVDTEKIVLSGGSAGGLIAGMCEPLTGISPAGLVLFYPGFLDEHMGPENLAEIVGTEAGGLPVTNPNTIRPGMPPMLIIHGEEDAVVPIETIRQYVNRAEDNGVNVTLSIYPGTGHGFFNYNKDRAHFYMGIGELLLFMKELNMKE